MSKAIGTTLSLAVSLALFSVGAMAQAAGSQATKDQNANSKEHHTRLTKLSFWRHHKDNEKAQAVSAHQHTTSGAKRAQAKQATAKPVQSKQAQPRPAQRKTSPAKAAASNKNQKPELRTVSMNKVPAKKGSAASRTKAQDKAKGHKTASTKPSA